MGLDICAYRGLKKVKNPVFDEDGNLEDYETQWHPAMEWSESKWKGRGEGVDPKAVYTWDEAFEFRAGSYIWYNRWRNKLGEFAKDEEFYELINFSDCEGVIGSVVAKKLLNDFKNNLDRAKEYSKTFDHGGEPWLTSYKDWMKAFEYASDNGAVDFY